MKNIVKFFNRSCEVTKYEADGTVFKGCIPLWLERAAGFVIYGTAFFLASQGAKRTWDEFCVYMAKKGIWSEEETEE